MKIRHKSEVSKNLEKNVTVLKRLLGVDKNFDVIQVDLFYAERNMALFFIDGFIKDDLFLHIMRLLSNLEPDQIDRRPLEKLVKTYIPYVEIETTNSLETVVDNVLSGPVALLVDGMEEAILIDVRTYPARNPEEPDIERVVRGARDGYVETLVMNTALTRRKIRDRSLRMEFLQVGTRSKTDTVICYLKDIADPNLVEKVKQSLKKIKTDAIPMAEKTVEEYISGQHWNPYPTVRYTERPDTAAAHLYEGHVCIIVDGSPSVIITPTTFWHHLQHAEEYRNKPIVGAYLRLIRYIGVFASIFLLPLWYLFAVEPELLPPSLSFIGPENGGDIPLFVQFFIIEIGIDLLRMAAIHTPSSLATALGLVAAVLIGEVAVEVGLFTHEVILYVAIVAIGTFATPSYELSLANRLFRLLLLLLTAAFTIYGFLIGTTMWILLLLSMKSYNVPYLWPFIPFHSRAFKDVFIRTPIPLKSRRPEILHPQDPDR
ncbi:spore germination protein [Fervidibacillus albus]|uniref:Spore germination protein n=1 Tax=Fervidibacillus albus TaxID=2980026 RepID=A0A9E8LVF1_9BACI|nr:spore germination protein [Fervidibacillus albus]WAA10418.1 spore germination protein [Fervidibacillus albus]